MAERRNYSQYHDSYENLFTYETTTESEYIAYEQPNSLQQQYYGMTSVPVRKNSRTTEKEKGSLEFLITLFEECIERVEAKTNISFDRKEEIEALKSKCDSITQGKKEASFTQSEFDQKMEEAQAFADTIVEAKRTVHSCPICQNLTDREICPICNDDMRDQGVICVVAEPKDVIALERSREFSGVYHVLHGVISPLNHVTQEDIRIKELLHRVATTDVREVIMATNPDTEGEATAMYISRLLRPMEIKVTRLAYGVPVGSQLEYADEVTLSRALEGRQEI